MLSIPLDWLVLLEWRREKSCGWKALPGSHPVILSPVFVYLYLCISVFVCRREVSKREELRLKGELPARTTVPLSLLLVVACPLLLCPPAIVA